MIIITRRVGETLMVGNDISVTTLGVKGNQVRIGVDCPREVAVHREEIYERIQLEKKQQVLAVAQEVTTSYQSSRYQLNNTQENFSEVELEKRNIEVTENTKFEVASEYNETKTNLSRIYSELEEEYENYILKNSILDEEFNNLIDDIKLVSGGLSNENIN